MRSFTCSECGGLGGTYLDASLTDKIPCKECNGTGEKQFKVIRSKNVYKVVEYAFLKRVYFKGNYLACSTYANELNKT